MKQITGSEKATAEQKKTDDKTLFSKKKIYIYIQNAFLTELKLFVPNFSFHA